LTARDQEFVVYRGVRQCPDSSRQGSSLERRAKFLLRQDVAAPASMDRFASTLNERHLVSDLAGADAFRQWCDRRVPEHAPFAVLALYARTAAVAGETAL
jgi:hypothetical protein